MKENEKEQFFITYKHIILDFGNVEKETDCVLCSTFNEMPILFDTEHDAELFGRILNCAVNLAIGHFDIKSTLNYDPNDENQFTYYNIFQWEDYY